MTPKIQPLNQINDEALELLTRELGVANTARFIQQFTAGAGDYTAERRERLKDRKLDDLLAEIRDRRADCREQR